MKLISLMDEDFVNYKVPCMYLIFPYCSYKCNIDCGKCVCQNQNLTPDNLIDISKEKLCERYLKNDITHAIVMAGKEPFDSIFDLIPFIDHLRNKCKCDDPIIIYTGYTEKECLGEDTYSYDNAVDQKILIQQYTQLKNYKNIIVKFGRFIPDSTSHFDEVLGVTLASSNQYAKQIS